MAFILDDVTIWLDGLDFSADFRELSLEATATAPDSTNFDSDNWMEFIPGLAQHSFSFGGFYDVDRDEQLFAAIGSPGVKSPLNYACAPDGTDYADVAYVAEGVPTSYSLGTGVGDVFPATVAGQGSGLLRRGQVLHDFGALGTATEASSRRTLGPLAADQRLTVWIIASIESGSLSAQLASHTSGSGGIETHRGAAVAIAEQRRVQDRHRRRDH